jgi:hypothetical protein
VMITRKPTDDKHDRFAKEQKHARNDVEQACVVLETLIRLFFWYIYCLTWTIHTMWEVMISYVIMHRTIVESKPDDLSTIKIENFMVS